MRRRALLGMAAAALGGGCGFELRGAPDLPFERIALAGFGPRSPLAEALAAALARSVQVVAQPAQAQLVLHALEDLREKTVVASTAAGQVREVQLRVRLRWRLATPGGRELLAPAELLRSRDMSYSETLALAKAQEEDELYRSLQADIVAQLLRRLASVRV